MSAEKKYYEIKNTYIQMGFGKGGVLYEPIEKDGRSRTAILVMHSDGDYYGFIPCPELARRGFTVMGANVHNSKSPLYVKIQDVGFYADYLRALPDIDRVIILGHSGGATLMSCYQAVAENGPAIFQDAGRIYPMPDIKPLTPAEAVMFLDTNWGNGVMNILSVNPMIIDENDPTKLNKELDPFDPANGFAADGAKYSEEFVAKYNKAQEERFNRLRDLALERAAVLDAGESAYDDDEPFIIHGGTQFAPNNRLFPQDTRYLNHTKEAYDLIHADGSITNEIVYTKRPSKFTKSVDRNFGMSCEVSTIKTYVSGSTIRSNGYRITETEVQGIDWDSAYSATPGNTKHISAPMLLMGMTGGYEFLASEIAYQNAQKTNDKTIAFVEGATHNFRPEKDAESFPGEFGDTVKLTFDYVADWILARF